MTSKDEDLWFGLRVSGEARQRQIGMTKGLNCREG